MTKKIFIGLAILAIVSAAAFASGQKEPGSAQAAPGAATGSTSTSAEQKLVLTGSVSLQGFVHPILKSGGKEYVLMVPPYLVYQSGVKEGAQVTVEGYQAPGTRWAGSNNGSSTILFVTKATVDGKDYDLTQYRGGMMGGAYGATGGYGMMGGRGTQGFQGMMGGRGAGRGGPGRGRGGFGGMMGGRGSAWDDGDCGSWL
jgi:hypothetical protein